MLSNALIRLANQLQNSVLPSIFVDIDETLLYNSSRPNSPIAKTLAERRGIELVGPDVSFKQEMDRGYFENAIRMSGSIPEEEIPEAVETAITRYIWVRPSAKPFLQELRSLGYQVYSFTAGQKVYQTKILELAGLDQYFDAIYARDFNPPQQISPFFILVDNLAFGTTGIQKKLKALGNRFREHLVQCTPYLGREGDPEPLTNLIPTIQERLNDIESLGKPPQKDSVGEFPVSSL